MSVEGEKNDAPKGSEHNMPSKISGIFLALAGGVFFLSESYWLIDKGEWPIWMDGRIELLFSVFFIFGKKIGIYGAATLTGLLGIGCIVGAIATVLERLKCDKKRDK